VPVLRRLDDLLWPQEGGVLNFPLLSRSSGLFWVLLFWLNAGISLSVLSSRDFVGFIHQFRVHCYLNILSVLTYEQGVSFYLGLLIFFL
jgi:hypothetical protein